MLCAHSRLRNYYCADRNPGLFCSRVHDQRPDSTPADAASKARRLESPITSALQPKSSSSAVG